MITFYSLAWSSSVQDTLRDYAPRGRFARGGPERIMCDAPSGSSCSRGCAGTQPRYRVRVRGKVRSRRPPGRLCPAGARECISSGHLLASGSSPSIVCTEMCPKTGTAGLRRRFRGVFHLAEVLRARQIDTGIENLRSIYWSLGDGSGAESLRPIRLSSSTTWFDRPAGWCTLALEHRSDVTVGH